MQTIGERLEEARKRKGISIREAAEATKIRSEYLHKLEGNSFDLGLPEIYIRGFLHNYAAYLKLNPDKLLADYRTLAPADGRAARRENRENYGRMDLGQAAAPAAEAPPPAASEGEAPAPAPAPARPSYAAPAGPGRSPVDPALLVKGAVVIVLAILLVVAVIFGIRALSGGSSRATAEIRAVAEQTITLTARDAVRIKLVQELDGAEIFQGTLIKGESRTFPKRGSLLLTATAQQNVDIEIDGKRRPNPYTGYMRVQIP